MRLLIGDSGARRDPGCSRACAWATSQSHARAGGTRRARARYARRRRRSRHSGRSGPGRRRARLSRPVAHGDVQQGRSDAALFRRRTARFSRSSAAPDPVRRTRARRRAAAVSSRACDGRSRRGHDVHARHRFARTARPLAAQCARQRQPPPHGRPATRGRRRERHGRGAGAGQRGTTGECRGERFADADLGAPRSPSDAGHQERKSRSRGGRLAGHPARGGGSDGEHARRRGSVARSRSGDRGDAFSASVVLPDAIALVRIRVRRSRPAGAFADTGDRHRDSDLQPKSRTDPRRRGRAVSSASRTRAGTSRSAQPDRARQAGTRKRAGEGRARPFGDRERGPCRGDVPRRGIEKAPRQLPNVLEAQRAARDIRGQYIDDLGGRLDRDGPTARVGPHPHQSVAMRIVDLGRRPSSGARH